MKITLYCAPGCKGSEDARRYLESRGLPFTVRDIARDPGAVRRLHRLGVFATPCLEVNGRVMVGFDPDELEALLEEGEPE